MQTGTQTVVKASARGLTIIDTPGFADLSLEIDS